MLEALNHFTSSTENNIGKLSPHHPLCIADLTCSLGARKPAFLGSGKTWASYQLGPQSEHLGFRVWSHPVIQQVTSTFSIPPPPFASAKPAGVNTDQSLPQIWGSDWSVFTPAGLAEAKGGGGIEKVDVTCWMTG